MIYSNYVSVPEAVWFSSLPYTWRATKMRELFSERNTKVSDKEYPALSVGKMGVVPQLETAVKTDNGDNRKLICKGDFAINSRSDRKGSSGISEYDGSSSLIITVLKPHNELNGRFYHYLLRSHYFVEEFYRNGHGLVSDLWTTKWDEMRNIYIPVPPREEQDHIVRYLDWQSSTVNKLIHGYQRQIKLLEERKKTIIDNTVIHGLNDSVDYITLEKVWNRTIPAHWKIVPFNAIAKEKSITNCSELELLSVYLGVGVIPFSKMGDRRANATSKDTSNYQRVDPGDFVMNNQQAWRGSVGVSDYTGIVSPAYIVLQLDSSLERHYANYLLRSAFMIDQFLIVSKGVGSIQRNINWVDFKRSLVPIPPVDEQKKIVEYLDSYVDRINQLIQKRIDKITYLREYLTRLISDVVSGQLDVRRIEIPDYTPEEDAQEITDTEELTDEEVDTDAE